MNSGEIMLFSAVSTQGMLAMTDDEKDYFRRRAEAELKQASVSECPEAVRVHYTLAGYYLDRVYGVAVRPKEQFDA